MSTTEVEAIIQKVVRLNDCVVFGVGIECCEGKAGMAVIAQPNGTHIDVRQLFVRLSEELPSYAVPLFVRLTHNIELTGSYKLSKHTLERQGFDPNIITDQLFFLDKSTQNYIPLTRELYQQIQRGIVSVLSSVQ